jgi:hypothetical protein
MARAPSSHPDGDLARSRGWAAWASRPAPSSPPPTGRQLRRQRSLKIAGCALLATGPVLYGPVLVYRGVHDAGAQADDVVGALTWLLVAAGLCVLGWLKPYTAGWLLLVTGAALLALLILAVEYWAHPWRDETWSLGDALSIAFWAGVPLVAGVTFLRAAHSVASTGKPR